MVEGSTEMALACFGGQCAAMLRVVVWGESIERGLALVACWESLSALPEPRPIDIITRRRSCSRSSERDGNFS